MHIIKYQRILVIGALSMSDALADNCVNVGNGFGSAHIAHSRDIIAKLSFNQIPVAFWMA
jgi:hypothetical protein